MDRIDEADNVSMMELAKSILTDLGFSPSDITVGKHDISLEVMIGDIRVHVVSEIGFQRVYLYRHLCKVPDNITMDETLLVDHLNLIANDTGSYYTSISTNTGGERHLWASEVVSNLTHDGMTNDLATVTATGTAIH